ncbi:Cytochrome b5 reductase 4 [Fasciolopsis buskii]|uniref:Cytochrome b5 reductase 4 n=1 Tax=Fasciolopsis buskii TaxID=27845 RepID=A0A8E0S3U2_9TREM|nr:Cytochrome b5 reductase 4 [Fasciolopsis buski]
MKSAPRINLSIDPEDENEKPPSGPIRKKYQQFGIGRWITYINSAEYQQIEPGNASISESELLRHNKSDDMWMALNHEGKRAVFDVTPFACCHPGGLEVLLEHAGTDASEAFRMAHAYVSVDMVGRLRKGFLTRSKLGTGLKPNQLSPSMVVPKWTLQQPTKPRWKWVDSESRTVTIQIHFPRFETVYQNWTSLEDLRILAHWTPQEKLVDQSSVSQSGQLLIRTLLDDGNYHRMEFRLIDSLHPHLPSLKLEPVGASSVGPNEAQLTIELNPIDPNNKKSIRTIGCVSRDGLVPHSQEADVNLNGEFFQCTVVESRMLISTRYRFLRLSWSDKNAWVPVPLGHHVILRLLDGSGQFVCRPYTPVCSQILPDCENLRLDLVRNTDLSLLIKIYPDGLMSQMLNQLKQGEIGLRHVSSTTVVLYSSGPFRGLRKFTLLCSQLSSICCD